MKYLAFVFGLSLLGLAVYLGVVVLNPEHAPEVDTIPSSTSTKSTPLSKQRELPIRDPKYYGIIDGALVHIGEGGPQVINPGPFTHLFYEEGGSIWVGNAIEKFTPDTAGGFPYVDLTLTEVNSVGSIVQQRTIENVDDIVYGPFLSASSSFTRGILYLQRVIHGRAK